MHEPRTRLGVAELTASMLVKGTKKRDALALAKKIDFVGGTMAADATFEATLVSCSVLARNTSTCLELLPEVITQPSFAESELSKVREQLIAGVRQRLDDAATMASAQVQNLLWGNDHVRGWVNSEQSLAAVKREDLNAWHKAWFVPSNAILVISGAVHDTGLVQIKPLALRDQIIVQGLVQFVLLATLVTARMSRRTALVAVGELERAVRVAAHREALLLEAREELERALRSGRGRFTGQTLSGYELGTVIGRGAMGEVYEATHPTAGRVAVKVLSQTSLSNPNHVLRFLRELRTAAGIQSPHVVRVIEVGEAPVPYLIMERLEGQTLGEILRNKRALSAADTVALITQIGAGITAAAASGIVHRDLKPQNLFSHHGVWKILDFGVARAIDSGDTLTAGHVVGTPSYMAPEQASGGTVDHCTDLYALAAIAFRALTGHPPFAGGEIAETLYRVVHTRPRRPTELTPTLHPDVDYVLAIGLAKRPTERFGAAIDFAGALAEALDGRLSQELRSRGEALIRNGAWHQNPRASTARMRPR